MLYNVCLSVWLAVCLSVWLAGWLAVCLYVTRTRTRTRTHTHVHVHVHVHVHIHTHTYTYTHTHIHVHVHLHIQYIWLHGYTLFAGNSFRHSFLHTTAFQSSGFLVKEFGFPWRKCWMVLRAHRRSWGALQRGTLQNSSRETATVLITSREGGAPH